MSSERPWLKFYPQDWRADEMLRNCSLAARGLWVEMLAIMHRSERYGYLLINGKPPNERSLAVQAGATIDEVKQGMAELEHEGVFSRDSDGLIFSRRMIRDDEKHRKASNFGKRGVRAKARKDKEEKPTLEGKHEGGLEGAHEGTHQLRDQRPDNPPVSPSLRVAKAKRLLPDDWEPEEFGPGTQCRGIVDGWSQIDLQRQINRFKAHHGSLGSRFVNWQRAWETWVLNSLDFDRSGRGRRDPPGDHSRPRDIVESVLAEHGRPMPP